jgi:hypothetical protein
MADVFDFHAYIEQRLAYCKEDEKHLELYSDDEMLPFNASHIYEEIVVPAPVEVFVNELNARRFVLPKTLHVLDSDPFVQTDLELNIRDISNLKYIILRTTNIVGDIRLGELFPVGVRYRYEECLLHGVELHTIINRLYEKYFGEKPRFTSTRICNQFLDKNNISSHQHSHIIDKILEYESRLAQGRAFRLQVKEELVEQAWHPRRVKKWIYADIDIDTL